MLNRAFLSVREEIAKVNRTHAAKERYVLITALVCWASVVAIAELKLGQYNHRNRVPVNSHWRDSTLAMANVKHHCKG